MRANAIFQAALFSVLCCAPLRAGIIHDFPGEGVVYRVNPLSPGLGLGGVINSYPFPPGATPAHAFKNNDNVKGKGDNVYGATTLIFYNTAPIDFIFQIDDSNVIPNYPPGDTNHVGGTPLTSEYWTPLSITNLINPGNAAWRGIRIRVGFGTYDANGDSFVANGNVDNLDFDFEAPIIARNGNLVLDPNNAFSLTPFPPGGVNNGANLLLTTAEPDLLE